MSLIVHLSFSVRRELFDNALLCFRLGRGESNVDILKNQGCRTASEAVMRCDDCTVNIELIRSLHELDTLLQTGEVKLN